MDTRTKITTPEAAAALAQPVILITGHFDGLLASHVRELARIRADHPASTVLVALHPPPEPLLEPVARAEMVAALAMVDYVVSLDAADLDRFLSGFKESRIVRLEDAHQQRMRELIEHVHRRQSA